MSKITFPTHEATSADGFTDWVCPVPTGYLMCCCDCGAVHEVDFRVVRYAPRPSEDFSVQEDPDLQCQFRMRRRDDLSDQREDAE